MNWWMKVFYYVFLITYGSNLVQLCRCVEFPQNINKTFTGLFGYQIS